VRRERRLSRARKSQGVVVHGGQSRGGLRVPHLVGHVLFPPLLCSGHDLAGTSLVRGVIEKSTDIVHEKWVEHFGDLFLVRKVERSFERNPVRR